MDVRLIQKGDRGLFISNGNKLLFPDRSWKDARVGFAHNIRITLDKGTYAFVKGDMLETLPIEYTDLMQREGLGAYYRKGEIEGQQYITEWTPSGADNGGYRIFVRAKQPDGASLERVVLTGRRDSAITCLSDLSKAIDVSEVLIKSSPELKFEDDYEYAFEMFKLLRMLYEKSGVGGRVKAGIRIYNSSIVVVKHVFEYSSPMFDVYRYVGEVGSGHFERVDAFPSTNAEKLFEKSEPLDMSEIESLAMEFKVCIPYSEYTGKCFDERLTSKVFECLGSGVVVYAFNMVGYDSSWFDTDEAQPYIDLVEDSFERLAYLKKRLAKTGVGLDKLSSLNVRRWLVPFEEK